MHREATIFLIIACARASFLLLNGRRLFPAFLVLTVSPVLLIISCSPRFPLVFLLGALCVLALCRSLSLYFRFQRPGSPLAGSPDFPSVSCSPYSPSARFSVFHFVPVVFVARCTRFLVALVCSSDPFPPTDPWRGSVSFAILPFVSSLCHYHSRPPLPLSSVFLLLISC